MKKQLKFGSISENIYNKVFKKNNVTESSSALMNRASTFDNNREGLSTENMDELQLSLTTLQTKMAEMDLANKQLELQLQQEQLQNQQLHGQVLQQQQQVQGMQQQSQQQGQLQQQGQQVLPCFMLQPRDIVEQFRRLRPLGDDNVMAFIKSVDSTFELCAANQQLLSYGLQIVLNEKIIGDVAKKVGDISSLNWENIKARLMVNFQPRITYGEVYNYCRSAKVSNLEELFCIFEKAKFDIHEIFSFDPLRPAIYQAQNVDRDLVDIMLDKIDGTVRAHIGANETMQDIIMKYTRLKLLWDRRTIDYRHRKNNNFLNERKYYQNKKINLERSGSYDIFNSREGHYNGNRNDNSYESREKNLYYNENSGSRDRPFRIDNGRNANNQIENARMSNNRNRIDKSFGGNERHFYNNVNNYNRDKPLRIENGRNLNNQNDYVRNSNSNRNPNNYNCNWNSGNNANYRQGKEANSNRTRNSHMSVTQQENLEDIHMDIGNGEENEVNFLIPPPDQNYP